MRFYLPVGPLRVIIWLRELDKCRDEFHHNSLDRVKSMKMLNEKQIAITHRNMEDFAENNSLDNLFTISLYSPSIGLVVDWSCNEFISYKVSITIHLLL